MFDLVSCFDGWLGSHCDGVEEIPVGSFVLLLPIEASDSGWAPVVTHDMHGARFTWVHPDTLQIILGESYDAHVEVGHRQKEMPGR